MPGTRKILLVEDEADLGEMISELLRELGFEVRLALTFSACLAAASTFRPSVVVTDLTLPDVEVDAVVPRLREAFPGIPILLTSAKAPAELRRIAAATGADGAVSKPFDIELFQSVVAELDAR